MPSLVTHQITKTVSRICYRLVSIWNAKYHSNKLNPYLRLNYFSANPRAVSDEHGKTFYQDITKMERNYQNKCKIRRGNLPDAIPRYTGGKIRDIVQENIRLTTCCTMMCIYVIMKLHLFHQCSVTIRFVFCDMPL